MRASRPIFPYFQFEIPLSGLTYIKETLFSPTLPLYEAFNPAAAEVNTQQVFPLAEFDVMKSGMAPEAAIDKAFKHLEAIYAKYPIQQA